MSTSKLKEKKLSRWYFGGIAATGAASVTHPLDLLKVQMQTHKGKNISMLQLTGIIIKNEGIRGLYNGISASLLRQMTYSTVRFGIYETAKKHFKPSDGSTLPFYVSASLAGLGGLAGGFVGNPADLVNVRMQNDVKLPPEQRRNYKNAFHGLIKVATTEGVVRLWTGSSMNGPRAALMTIGQVAFYDLIKELLLTSKAFGDNVATHVTSSLLAGAIATTLTQPVDVLKTRAMNAKPGEVKGILVLVANTAKEGPSAFFKGFIPAFVRIAPHTILTYKNAFHGLIKVATTEGVVRLWTGSSMNGPRAALMTIGQVAFYDLIKELLLTSKAFGDNVATHVTSSLLAGAIATTLTQPVDVLKTRAMNAKPGEVKGILVLVANTAKEGPSAFFKGFIPAFVRIAPHTILTFVFLEQLRIHFGAHDKKSLPHI